MDTAFFCFVLACFINSFYTPHRLAARKSPNTGPGCGDAVKSGPAVSRDKVFLRLGLALTVAADFCMLILYKNFAGLCLFCVAQTLYHIRYASRRPVIFQLVLCAAILVLPVQSDWQNKVAAAYAVCLLCSVTAAVRAAWAANKKGTKQAGVSNKRLMAAAAMVLFLLCDINVMLYNVAPSLDVRNICHILIWVFYLPSQALLSSSGEAV